MTFEEKTMHMAIGIGAIETIRYEEEKINPKSARAVALQKLIDHAEKVIAFYKMNEWDADNLDKATKCFTVFENKVRQAFNPKIVNRGADGRFQQVEAAQ